MARSDSNHLPNQYATVRQLKLLVIVLVFSNIGLGAVSFYLLREIDRTYSTLFDQSVPVLSDLQTLTARAVGAMRGTNGAMLMGPAGAKAEPLERARAEFQADLKLRQKLLKAEWLPGSEQARTEFQVAGDEFSDAGTEVMAAFAAGRNQEAEKIRDEKLRPAFERYLDKTTRLSDVVEAVTGRANDAVSVRAGRFSNIMLGLASWPVLLLIGLLLLTAIFVVVLMVLFRGREMSDMP